MSFNASGSGRSLKTVPFLKDPMDYKCQQLLIRTIISQKHLFSVDLYVDSFIKSLTDHSEHLAHTH